MEKRHGSPGENREEELPLPLKSLLPLLIWRQEKTLILIQIALGVNSASKNRKNRYLINCLNIMSV